MKKKGVGTRMCFNLHNLEGSMVGRHDTYEGEIQAEIGELTSIDLAFSALLWLPPPAFDTYCNNRSTNLDVLKMEPDPSSGTNSAVRPNDLLLVINPPNNTSNPGREEPSCFSPCVNQATGQPRGMSRDFIGGCPVHGSPSGRRLD